jgi:hypothetical protein
MTECEFCLDACMHEPDVDARVECMSLLLDCIGICAMSAKYMAGNSRFASQVCGLCAEICDACADECDKFKDNHCQTCADICRQCAAECRAMATA